MKRMNHLLILLYIAFIFLKVTAADDDVCLQQPDVGACSATLLAWYYEPEEEQCLEFIYGGCGGNGNKFATEEECYQRCGEQLINLHPPEKVSVPFALHDRIYLYWLPPSNYKNHDPTNETHTIAVDDSGNLVMTSKGAGVAHLTTKATVVTTMAPANSGTAKPQQNSSKSSDSGLDNGNDKNTDIGKTNQNDTKADIDKTGNSTDSAKPGSETNVTKHSVAGVTESVNESKNVSANSNETDSVSGDNATPAMKSSDNNTTQKPAASTSVTANSTGDSAKVDNKTIVYKLEDFMWKEKVPFHFAVLTGYMLSYRKNESADWISIKLPTNTTEYSLKNLTADTMYTIRVGAVYLTKTAMFAPEIKTKTQRDPSAKRNCYCNAIGTSGGGTACSFTSTLHPWCHCKPQYAGLFCELCHFGYYRLANTMPCHACPCSTKASSGHCHFIEGYLHCIDCKDGYIGRMCQHCANGYYREHRNTGSVCVKCKGCHAAGNGQLICEPSTGRCITCHYNTTGHKCDRCLPGFEGDPLKNISCTLISGKHKAGVHMLSSGIIAVICVITILALSAIVGCIIYRRMKNYPHNRPFWTIELKEGHEGVNFSSVPDDDLDRYHDDVRFIDKESKSKSQPYARLQEDI